MNFNDLDEDLKTQLLKAKELASNRLLRPNFFGNVAGVGIGEKVTDGDPTGNACVRIYVQSKLELDDLTPAYLLPSSFLDIPTDIIEVGRLGLAKVVGQLPEAPTISPGCLIRLQSKQHKNANLNSGAVGTLGAIVDRGGVKYILCCNHILNVNGRVNADLKNVEIVSGDLGFVAGPPTIATPTEYFVPLKRNGKNYVDCALAEVDPGLLTQDPKSQAPGKTQQKTPKGRTPEPLKPMLQAKFPEIGSVNSTLDVEPFVGQRVRKAGAVTGVTSGVVVDVNADFYIDYGFGTFLFKDQVVIDGKGQGNFKGKDQEQLKDIFATDGDSGAIVVDEENHAVAMVFAEAGRFAVACKFSKVLEEIGLLFNPGPAALKAEKARLNQVFTIVNDLTSQAFTIVNTLKKETSKVPRSPKYKK
jgi:hypothetical protein